VRMSLTVVREPVHERIRRLYLGGCIPGGSVMRIRVINSNTTRSMTVKIRAAAKAAASPGVEVTAVNPEFGPASIEGYFDEAFSIPGLIEEIGKARDADALSSPASTPPGSKRRDARPRHPSLASAKPRSTWRARSLRNSAS
jgi:hypothetical protein